MKEQISACKMENPTWGYKRIARFVGTSPNVVKYHLVPAERMRRKLAVQKHRRTQHPLYRKIMDFCRDTRRGYPVEKLLKFDDVLASFGDVPKCYLTGEIIDLMDRNAYSLDHKTPRAQAGKASLENCGLITRKANIYKNANSVEEFLVFCERVLTNHGYTVIKLETTGNAPV